MPLKQRSQRNRSFQRRAAAMMSVATDVESAGPLPSKVIEFGTATFDQVGSTEPRDVALSLAIDKAETGGGSPLTGDVSLSIVANNSGKASRGFAEFDGVDDLVSLSPSPMAGKASGTIAIWIKPNTIGLADGSKNLINSGGFYLALGRSDEIMFFNGLWRSSTSSPIAVGEWSHVALTYVAGTVKIYVNGIEVLNVATSMPSLAGAFIVGRSGYEFDGNLRALQVFDSALSAASVGDVMAGVTGSLSPYLSYAFDDGSGATVADSSGNGNDGTAVNTDATFWGFETVDVTTPTTLIDQVLQWGDDLSAVTTGFTGTLVGGGSIDFAGDPDVDSYVVTLGGKSQTIHHSKPVILRESWDGGGVSYIHYGIGKVNLNIDNGDWAIADVRKFGVVRHQDYFRGWTETSDALFIESLVEFNHRHPGAITCAHFRFDLARFGEAGSLRPFWGANGFPSLTLAMSSKPRDTINWLDFVAANMPGWSQAPSNITPAIGNPYNLSLVPDGGGAGVHHWICRAAKMDISNSAWLNAAADAAKLVRQKVNEAAALIDPAITNALAATHVGPEKWQFAKPKTRTRVFKQWILENANPGWVLNSNSGGSVEASWPDHAEMFDQPGETVLDVFEASWTMAALMGAKDPGGLVVYDPVNYHVGIAASNQQIFKDQCLDKYGMTGEQAREYFRDKQYEIAALDHVRYLVPVKTNTGAGDSEAELFQGFMTTAEVQILRDIATFKPMIYPPHNQLVPTV